MYWFQFLLLLGGAGYAWTTVFQDFQRFFNVETSLLAFRGTLAPNPLGTPCLYGAVAFLIAAVWSLTIALEHARDEQRKQESKLRWLLVAFTIFAWGNFGWVAYRFYCRNVEVSCTGTPVATPFETPCFIGSCIFLAALLTSIVILRKTKYHFA